MASFTERYSEVVEAMNGLFPANRVAAAYNTEWVSMETFHRAICQMRVGVMTQASTIDLILQEATDAAGTGVAAIAGKAITQLTQAGGDGNDTVWLELRSEELTPGFDFVRALLTVGAAASFTDVQVLRTVPRYPPVSTTVITEIIP